MQATSSSLLVLPVDVIGVVLDYLRNYTLSSCCRRLREDFGCRYLKLKAADWLNKFLPNIPPSTLQNVRSLKLSGAGIISAVEGAVNNRHLSYLEELVVNVTGQVGGVTQTQLRRLEFGLRQLTALTSLTLALGWTPLRPHGGALPEMLDTPMVSTASPSTKRTSGCMTNWWVIHGIQQKPKLQHLSLRFRLYTAPISQVGDALQALECPAALTSLELCLWDVLVEGGSLKPLVDALAPIRALQKFTLRIGLNSQQPERPCGLDGIGVWFGSCGSTLRELHFSVESMHQWELVTLLQSFSSLPELRVLDLTMKEENSFRGGDDSAAVVTAALLSSISTSCQQLQSLRFESNLKGVAASLVATLPSTPLPTTCTKVEFDLFAWQGERDRLSALLTETGCISVTATGAEPLP